MSDLLNTANIVTAFFTITGTLGGIIGGIKISSKKNINAMESPCKDYILRDECVMAQVRYSDDVKEVKESIEKEHKENREDHKMMFKKIDSLTEIILKCQKAENGLQKL